MATRGPDRRLAARHRPSAHPQWPAAGVSSQWLFHSTHKPTHTAQGKILDMSDPREQIQELRARNAWVICLDAPTSSSLIVIVVRVAEHEPIAVTLSTTYKNASANELVVHALVLVPDPELGTGLLCLQRPLGPQPQCDFASLALVMIGKRHIYVP